MSSLTGLSFVVIPQDGSDWIINAKATVAVIVWVAAMIGALIVISRVRLRKARAATAYRPSRPVVTIGSGIGSALSYMLRPVARFGGNVVQDAVEPMIDTLRIENSEQHAETSSRLSAVEEAVRDLSIWRDKVDAIMRPSEAMEALVSQMQGMANIVQTDRQATKDRIETLDARIQKLMQLLMDRRVMSPTDET